MTLPQRHTLCYLTQNADPTSLLTRQERYLFEYWLEKQFPFIVTMQPQHLAPQYIQIAFPLFHPQTREKIRFSTQVLQETIHNTRQLPMLHEVFPQWQQSANIGVYGSYAWQYLTQQPYVHAASDLDLLITYEGQSLEDLKQLHQAICHTISVVQLDGEIRLAPFGDCAWLELIQPNPCRTILFKSIQKAQLISRDQVYEQLPTLIA